VDNAAVDSVIAQSVDILRREGARFAYLHGSRTADPTQDSDIDLAAYFGHAAPQGFDVLLPPRVDLLVLDRAPLELAGRVAARGRLLFEDDPVSRVRWESMTRKMYFDELPRMTRAHREFAASVLGG
jgi:predicted nucleotidyltransferase